MQTKSKSIFTKCWEFLGDYSLYLSIGLLAVIFFHYYPSTFVSVDEHDYLHNAQLLLTTGLRQECNDGITQYPVSNYCVSKYNVGTSLFYLPVAVSHPQWSFAITFIVFLIGICAFHAILRLLLIDKMLTFLYAFFPAYIFYSRTLFSEIFSTTLILIVVYLLLRFTRNHSWKVGLLAGIVSGFAIFVRYTNVIPIGLMFVLFWISEFRITWQKLKYFSLNRDEIWQYIMPVLIGLLPLLALIALTNLYLYGAVLRSGYYFSHEEVLNLLAMPGLLLRFSLVLLTIYPGMLVIPFFIKMTQRSWLLIPAIATVIFYSTVVNSLFEDKVLDLILGIRFIIPITPLFILLYAKWLNGLLRYRLIKLILVCLIAALGASVWYISKSHQEYLQTSAPDYGTEILTAL